MDIKKSLKEIFGFDSFKDQQEKIIQSLLSKKNVFVIMPTGGGKSLCYQLPAIMSEGTAIVVSPLIALMKNQVDSIRSNFSENSIAHVLNSSLTKTEIKRVKADLAAGKTKLLFVAPESLNKEEYREFLTTIPISFCAIDEAHCISEWGHDFRPDYSDISNILKHLGKMPIIALTATATPKVQEDILNNLGIKNADIYKSSFNRPNLFYEVKPKDKEVNKEIIRFIKRKEGKSGIVYCMSRKKVDEISELLNLNGVKALPYHAGFDAKKREQAQDDFVMDRAQIIVATIAFGMGIDKPDVRFVIHHDVPKSIESYYQETGRAGRDGGEGHCLLFYSQKDIEKMEKLNSDKSNAEQELARFQIQEMMAYAETNLCRRKYLLHYFGEKFDDKKGLGAKMDDNSLKTMKKEDASKQARLFMKTIQETHEIYKAQDIISILLGNENSKLSNHNVKKNIEQFSKGKKNDIHYWKAIHRQTLIKDFLFMDIEEYGVLKITKKGKKFIESDETFKLTLNKVDTDESNENKKDENIQGNQDIDEKLYKVLLKKRQSYAEKNNVPPYTILLETSLVEICKKFPQSEETFSNIQGISAAKARKISPIFLPTILSHLESMGIVVDEEIKIKQVATSKNKNKIQIIKAIDRKNSIQDIAIILDMSLPEIITEMENIVFSGSKLNISYIIDEILDEDDQQEIYDYLMNHNQESSDAFIDEFIDVYSEEELRLMRIKFLSEVAN